MSAPWAVDGDDSQGIGVGVAFCDGMSIRSGPPASIDVQEREHGAHRIDVPGLHASAILTCGGGDERRDIHISDRHVAVIPAGHLHRFAWSRGARVTSIMVQVGFLRGLARANRLRHYEMAPQFACVDPFLWHTARVIEQQLRSQQSLETAYMDALAIVIAQHLLTNYAGTPAADGAPGGLPRYKLRRAIDYVRAHYHEEIGYKDIAGQLEMNPFHFARMFKQSTNESPHQFITRCRIDAAQRLLIEGERSIADIAFEVGYKSQSHFTTRFALLVGSTPAAFRNSGM